MKLAVVIAGAEAPPSAFVVWRGFETSIRKAAEYGYDGVELALKEAADVKARDLDRWLARWNLEASCISTGQVFAALGLCFTHPDPNARLRLAGVFADLIKLAGDFGGRINIGRVRGFYDPGQSREQTELLFIDSARRISDLAARSGVDILIEPVNRYELDFINTLDDAARLATVLRRPNLGLMPDLFHMNIEERRIGESLARNGSMIRYVHLADSNRLAPGQGHIDFADAFAGLKNAEFHGWASVEILPLPDGNSAARRALDYLNPLVKRFNGPEEGRT